MKQDRLRNDIGIYKGTDKGLTINFKINNTIYVMQPNDEMTLEVRDYRNNNVAIITKTSTGSNHFSFSPSDTEELDIGYYMYNVKFSQHETGYIYQIISPSIFHIKAGE